MHYCPSLFQILLINRSVYASAGLQSETSKLITQQVQSFWNPDSLSVSIASITHLGVFHALLPELRSGMPTWATESRCHCIKDRKAFTTLVQQWEKRGWLEPHKAIIALIVPPWNEGRISKHGYASKIQKKKKQSNPIRQWNRQATSRTASYPMRYKRQPEIALW